MSKSAKLKVVAKKISGSGQTGPKTYTSSGLGVWGAKPTTYTMPKAGAPAPPQAAPPPPTAPGTPNRVDPFFRPEDLLTQNNFWAQWNSTFADLDQKLADLQANTAFNRAQLADQHRHNASDINDNAAARGISQSSIRDGNQAQEQTNYTRNDQNLRDALARFGQYVQGQKTNFQTNILPGFNTAEDQQAVQNANDVNANQVMPPPVAAPTAAVAKPAKPTVIGQSQQPITPHPHAVVHHALHLIHAATGWGGRYHAPTSGAFGRPR